MSIRSVLSGFLLVLAVVGVACNSATSPTTVSAVSVVGTTPAIGASAQFTATATVSDAAQDVTSSAAWSSSDTTVATVSASGLVTAVASGTAVITATYSNVAGALTITVS